MKDVREPPQRSNTLSAPAGAPRIALPHSKAARAASPNVRAFIDAAKAHFRRASL